MMLKSYLATNYNLIAEQKKKKKRNFNKYLSQEIKTLKIENHTQYIELKAKKNKCLVS